MQTKNRLPTVAVLMAVYNGELYLHEQLDSILAQQNVEVKIYVRDDHSTDTTVEIITEFIRKTGKVFLLDSKPTQLRVTKNFYSIVREIDLTEIDYMCYSDQDDIWLPEKIEQAIKGLQINHVQCYASNLLRADANGNLIQEKSILKRLFNYLLNRKSVKQTAFDHYLESASAGCTLVLQKDAALYFQKRINQIYELLPVDTSHDWSTYAITRLGGFKWFIDQRSFIIYRQHAENAYGANVGIAGISKLLEWFTSGRYRMHILMIEGLFNISNNHPPFIEAVKNYRQGSIISRFRMAYAICRYRRKWIHRIIIFILIIFGYCK